MLLMRQSTGAYKAASRLAIATPPPAYVLSRGIGWQVGVFNITIIVYFFFFLLVFFFNEYMCKYK